MLHDFGSAVNEYYVGKFRELARARAARIAGLDTPEKVLAYAAGCRRKIRAAFGLENRERKPMRPRVTGEFDFGLYRLRRVIIDPDPGYFMTGNLYLPPASSEPFPAVLHLCGHNGDGKSCQNGVSLNVGLAANGVAVFAVDPVCQGERLQHFLEDDFALCGAHNMLGKEMVLYGEYFCSWRAWDALRAIDCMVSLPELDGSKIMLTGCSGGGTMTCWVNALDDRIIASAPSCATTRWYRTVENENPIDAEQLPPGLAGEGLDMADFLIASLPRPVLVSGETNDFFDERGQREVGTELEKLCAVAGAPGACGTFVGPHGHGLKPEQREAIRAFFFRAAGVTPKGIPEDDIPRPTTEQKLAAPGGNVFNIPGNLPAMELLKRRCAAVAGNRPRLDREGTRRAVRDLLKLPEKMTFSTDYRRLPPQPVVEGKTLGNRYLLENDRRILGVLHHVAAEGFYQLPGPEKAVLFLPCAKSEEMLELPAGLFADDEKLFGFDTFGIGELAPSSCGKFAREMTDDYGVYWHYAGLGTMLGEPFPGLQTEGVLAAVSLLRARGVKHLTLCGRKYSAPLALFAALLAPEGAVDRTLLLEPPASYGELVGRVTPQPFTAMVPGILKYTDLPEIERIVGAERIDLQGSSAGA
ncbi:MAG: acetylxylan esterase [Lentisphaeria bacterium]|nr:acetylxylan esterase [Lentisphaeria bacterium]